MQYIGKEKTVGFNSEWVASLSLEDFLEHEKHHGFSLKEMKDIHRICVKKYQRSSAAGEPKDINENPAS